MGLGFKLIPVNDKYARFIIITCLNLISQNTAQTLLEKIIKENPSLAAHFPLRNHLQHLPVTKISQTRISKKFK